MCVSIPVLNATCLSNFILQPLDQKNIEQRKLYAEHTKWELWLISFTIDANFFTRKCKQTEKNHLNIAASKLKQVIVLIFIFFSSIFLFSTLPAMQYQRFFRFLIPFVIFFINRFLNYRPPRNGDLIRMLWKNKTGLQVDHAIWLWQDLAFLMEHNKERDH